MQDPEQALRGTIAYQIVLVGMRKGILTGKTLADASRNTPPT